MIQFYSNSLRLQGLPQLNVGEATPSTGFPAKDQEGLSLFFFGRSTEAVILNPFFFFWLYTVYRGFLILSDFFDLKL